MDSPLPRVSIAVPSGDMVHADFAKAYAELCMAAFGLPLQLITSKSSIIAKARNTGVDQAKKFGAHYLLFLDSDMAFPSNDPLAATSAWEGHRGCNVREAGFPI